MLKFNFQQKASKTPTNQFHKSKKHSTSQIKYQKSPDIITQVNPVYFNNFIQQVNPHQLAFTPTNHSKILQHKNMLLPQKSKEFVHKKTLILDLDETLVHSSFVPFEKNDIILDVEFESVIYNIFVLVRPGAIEFIKKVAKLYEIVIFTASISKYALPLLEILDEEKNIKFKLTREHCTFLNGIYIKELKKLNRDLNDLIILDNSPLAYSFDSDNGLPIKAWYEDRNDTELERVYILLEFLSKVKDVRIFVKKFVNNNEINFDVAKEIIKIYNENMDEISLKKNNSTKNREDQKEKDKDKKKILIKIKQNNPEQEKVVFTNNKENNNIINIKNGEKIIKTNIKPNKGIILNNINHTPPYRNIINNNKKEISYNNYINNYNLSKNNKNKNSFFINKNKSKETNLKSNIQNNQKKKNTFRIASKLNDKNNNQNSVKKTNIHLKHNNIYFLNNTKYFINNNNDNDIIFSNTLSKTTKDCVSSKNKIQFNINMNIEANKRKKDKENLFLKSKMFSDNNLNLNYINKKYKYTNLLEKLERKTIKTSCSLNNKANIRSKSSKIMSTKNNSKKKSINNQINSKKKLNHVGSYVLSKYNALKITNVVCDNKLLTSNTVTRSKSTGNFINFEKNNKKPKSSTVRYNFHKNIIITANKDINKYNKNKAINLLYAFPKTTVNKDKFHYFINDEYKNII